MTEPEIAFPSGPLLAGKRGLVMGVANDHSLAWGIARAAHAHGAELAFTYQGESLGRRVRPLTEKLGAALIYECDVENEQSLAGLFTAIEQKWGRLDFLVHAIAFSDRKELAGRYVETTRDNFRRTMDISCYSFTDLCRRAEPLMAPGSAALTLTYLGAERAIPSYNVMGIAKAALEASVRYLAADLGPKGIRVNAVSAGPMRTLSGAGVGNARFVFNWNKAHSPLRRTPTLDEVSGAGLYFLSPLSGGVTGQVHYVDCGFSVIGIPQQEDVVGGEGNGG